MVYDFDPYGSKKPKQGKTVDEKYGIGGDYKPEKKERYDSRREKPPEYTPMKEIERSVVASETIHNEMVNDIDDDIIEKRQMVGVVSDLNERRNLKLDISILRKEKRHENV